MATRKKSANFEKTLESLEALVEEMELGDLSLDEALKSFEKGIKLTQECQIALDEAEQKVAILLSDDAAAEPVPFETAES